MEQKTKFAGFWNRTNATMQDFFLGTLILALYVYFLISSSNSFNQLFYNFISSLVLFLPLNLLLGFLYAPYFTSKYGGTLGKLVNGIKVTDDHGNLLSFKKSMFRYWIGYPFAAAPLSYGFMTVAKDPEKKGWHDHATGSRVVVVQNRWWLGLVAMLLYTFICAWLIGETINKYSNSGLKTEVEKLFEEKEDQEIVEMDPDNYLDDMSETGFSSEFSPVYDKMSGYFLSGDYKAIIELEPELLETAADNYERSTAYGSLARAYYLDNQYAKAATNSQLAIDLEPEFAYAYETLAYASQAQNNYRQAEAAARKLVEVEDWRAENFYILASILYYQYKDVEAIKTLKIALEKDPTNETYKTTLKTWEDAYTPTQ